MVKRRMETLITMLFAVAIAVVLCGIRSFAAEGTVITFSDSGISMPEENGLSVEGTTLTIKESGTYTVTGNCSEGNIEIAKGISVTLYMNDFSLKSIVTAPVVVKKGSNLILSLEGENTLISAENPENENSADEEVADAFEGAAIKVKSGSTLTVMGSGILNIDASACKNGIKGGATTAIIVNEGTLNIDAANTGIGCDGVLTINGGNINISSDSDGMKADPDADDTESEGRIVINGGIVKIDAGGDGISAAKDLTVTGGNFDIITMSGYSDRQFDSDTMSCKGLKASAGNLENIESRLNISGGTFNINTPDDAIHSDAYVDITGGSFTIYTADDGAHADIALNIGAEGGTADDLLIDIKYCYEGLEGGTVNIYSGTMNVTGTDDGINSAGGSTSGSDPGMGGGNSFRPGSGSGFGPGSGTGQNSGNYHINIYGGKIYINVDGDGIDANGNINITGGSVEVWGMRAGGDNSPLDFDGKLTINNAEVFAGGTKGVDGYIHNEVNTTSSYIYSTSTYQNNTVINVMNGSGKVIYTTTAPKNANYLFYIPADSNSSFVTGKVEDNDEKWPFNDVAETANGADLLKQAYDLGIVSGVTKPDENGQVKYKPANNVTRAQFAIMLYKLAEAEGLLDKDTSTEAVDFSDISQGDTGYEAVVWASSRGIISGFDNGTFKPAKNITRAQIAMMLMRYAEYAGNDTSAVAELTGFADYDTVGDNSVAGLKWIIGEEIMSGISKNGENYIYPNKFASRLQCAMFVMRYYNLWH